MYSNVCTQMLLRANLMGEAGLVNYRCPMMFTVRDGTVRGEVNPMFSLCPNGVFDFLCH